MVKECKSPFGGSALIVLEMDVRDICFLYLLKCGVDVRQSFNGYKKIGLYKCSTTGYRFWRPEKIAADENLYKLLRINWKNYLRPNRWEYEIVDQLIPDKRVVLEVGCGSGHFLKKIADRSQRILGIEPNPIFVANSLVPNEVFCADLNNFHFKNNEMFDYVLSFQVLEHLVHPEKFLKECQQRTKLGGYLIVSTPNYLYRPHMRRQDAFDLPPHHMGHFTKGTFYAISKIINLSLVEIIEQNLNTADNLLGPNLIAIFRKS